MGLLSCLTLLWRVFVCEIERKGESFLAGSLDGSFLELLFLVLSVIPRDSYHLRMLSYTWNVMR